MSETNDEQPEYQPEFEESGASSEEIEIHYATEYPEYEPQLPQLTEADEDE